jgi:hypothetical protein
VFRAKYTRLIWQVFEKQLVGERGFEPPTPWSRNQ